MSIEGACMSFLNSLPRDPHLADVFKKFPRGVKPLLEFHDIILREDSSLSIGEREMIAAYVSGLNGCDFCYGAHTRIAEVYGVSPSLLAGILNDVESSSIDNKFKPVLVYVKKLTLTPSKIIKKDIDQMLDAGWDDAAVYDIATVCALFNFMNRIVDGMGVRPSISVIKEKEGSISRSTYQDFGRAINVLD
jgi:uncharacterized peroxidase-related enzyme